MVAGSKFIVSEGSTGLDGKDSALPSIPKMVAMLKFDRVVVIVLSFDAIPSCMLMADSVAVSAMFGSCSSNWPSQKYFLFFCLIKGTKYCREKHHGMPRRILNSMLDQEVISGTSVTGGCGGWFGERLEENWGILRDLYLSSPHTPPWPHPTSHKNSGGGWGGGVLFLYVL